MHYIISHINELGYFISHDQIEKKSLLENEKREDIGDRESNP